MAQQLILDRRVGSYVVPDGWFIWAAGNRKEDRAAVFDMPTPLANRLLHLEVEPDLDSFKSYGLERNLHEQILSFLSLRTTLLHKLDPYQTAWPSPRSWEMASRLHSTLPDLGLILDGAGATVDFPAEPSARYAATIGLSVRAANAQQAYHAFGWLVERAGAEWAQLFAADLFRQMRAKGQMGVLVQLVQQDQRLQQFMQDYRQLITGSSA